MSIQFGPEWEQFNRRLIRTPQLTEDSLRRTLTSSLLLLEADAKRSAVRDTGRLGGSINYRIDGAYPRLEGRVGPGVRYGSVVEFGRRAGARMPPVDALIGWVRRHWLPRGASIAGARFRGRARNAAWRGREAELRSAAFVLARAIGRRGIQAQPYMAPSWVRNRVRIQQAFARIGVRTVAFLAGQPLP